MTHIASRSMEDVLYCFRSHLSNFKVTRTEKSSWIWFKQDYSAGRSNQIPYIWLVLDLSEAFDTVNHEILLMELHKYDIRRLAYKWFNSYLCNRQQYVSFNGNDSQSQVI